MGPVRGQLSAAYQRQKLRPGGWKAASLWELGVTLLGLLQTPGLQLPQVPCSPRGTSSGEATLCPCNGLRLPLDALRPPEPLGLGSGCPCGRPQTVHEVEATGALPGICWLISACPHPFLIGIQKPPVLGSVSKVGDAQAAGAPGSPDGCLIPGSSSGAHSLAQPRVGNSEGSLGAAGRV